MTSKSQSTRVPGRYPIPGSSPIADRIRQRRGRRGLTPLDGTLLHFPPFADGWNSLAGAVRSEGGLPADIREAIILRVAADNHSAFQWIQHEPVARAAGLSTVQLTLINDINNTPTPGSLTPLMVACLNFTDASTKDVYVPDTVFAPLRRELSVLAAKGNEEVEDLLVEVAGVAAAYNMVSRFLVSLDVAGKMEKIIKVEDITEHTIPIPSTSLTLRAITHVPSNPNNRFLIFSNSLLTSTALWSLVASHFFLLSYTLILFDQRGHGSSSVPDPPRCSVEDLADDIKIVMDHFKVDKAHAVIGVSQGGAATLQFALKYPHMVDRVVVCDTQSKTPEGNIKAWDDRIKLARKEGMRKLAEATATRWFPPGSPWANDEWVLGMIENTPIEGFITGARALQSYDLISQGLLRSKVKTLLMAGELDAGGKIAEGLRMLREAWVGDGEGGDVRFVELEGCGHLPMVDGWRVWVREVREFLEE